jgi:hypothetical protein
MAGKSPTAAAIIHVVVLIATTLPDAHAPKCERGVNSIRGSLNVR